MKQKTKNRHEFALYQEALTASLSKTNVGKQLVLTDQESMHRITRVLRLQEGEQLMLFDRHHNVLVELGATNGKKELITHIVAINPNKQLEPHITFFLPLLKRDACDSALYSLVETGVNTIQLVITEKTQRTLTPHEVSRAERTMLSAAEQSKNFNVPTLLPPISFAQCVQLLQKETGLKVFFDPEGIPLIEQIDSARKKKPNRLSLMIGPEGDLSPAEKQQLQEAGVTLCALTPTILRACQAAALSSAIFRSIL
jgi:16S rRNA (uracil1498-N3)-methyltransferase